MASGRSRTPTRRWPRRSGGTPTRAIRSRSTSPIRGFLAAYFDLVHRPLEDQGVDFWWIDWQSGPHSRIVGIDPLWMLNHFHFLDNARGGRRPLTFSRYAGPGSHRYPVGFSGDTLVTWASLDFQPYFTATASNVGYGWWSHDIGGHMLGGRDDELATRLGAARGVLPDHAAAFGQQPVQQQGAVAIRCPGPVRDDGFPAPAAPAAAVSAHHEPPRGARRCAPGATHVLVAPGPSGGVRGAQSVHLRHRTASSRRSRRPRTAPCNVRRSGCGCPRDAGSMSSPAWSTRAAGRC